MNKCLLLSVVVIIALTSTAADTNKVFFNDDGFPYINHAQKIEDAKKSKESLPAGQFPEGNWGSTTNGYQLSIRFEKTSFELGEPISAIILLRNVTNRVLTYRIATTLEDDGPIAFNVTGSDGLVTPVPWQTQNVVSSRSVVLVPESQRKYVERLDKRYKLIQGNSYTVCARFRTGCPDCFEIKSAETRIKIAQ